MIRGEFHRADGLVIRNNVTRFGGQNILRAFVRGTGLNFFVGLGQAVYDPLMTAANVVEPAAGGYTRSQLIQTQMDWPFEGTVNGEPWIESRNVTFEPSASYAALTSRVILFDAASAGNVYALSGAIPDAQIITPQTPVQQRTFRYRLYLG